MRQIKNLIPPSIFACGLHTLARTVNVPRIRNESVTSEIGAMLDLVLVNKAAQNQVLYHFYVVHMKL